MRGSRPRSQPLVCPPSVMPTPHTQRPSVSSPRYGPAIPLLRPQPFIRQPPIYDRPASTDNYPCTDPSPRRRLRATAHEIYTVRSSPLQASQSPARHTSSPQEVHSPHLLVAEEIPSLPQKGSSNDQKAPIFVSRNSRVPLVLTPFKESTYQNALLIYPLHHNIHLNPQLVPVLLDN